MVCKIEKVYLSRGCVRRIRTTAMHVHDEADPDECGKQSGQQVEEVWSARTAGTKVRARRALKPPPDGANAGDDTEHTETVEDSSPIHTDGNTQIEVKLLRVRDTLDRFVPYILHAPREPSNLKRLGRWIANAQAHGRRSAQRFGPRARFSVRVDCYSSRDRVWQSATRSPG